MPLIRLAQIFKRFLVVAHGIAQPPSVINPTIKIEGKNHAPRLTKQTYDIELGELHEPARAPDLYTRARFTVPGPAVVNYALVVHALAGSRTRRQ